MAAAGVTKSESLPIAAAASRAFVRRFTGRADKPAFPAFITIRNNDSVGQIYRFASTGYLLQLFVRDSVCVLFEGVPLFLRLHDDFSLPFRHIVQALSQSAPQASCSGLRPHFLKAFRSFFIFAAKLPLTGMITSYNSQTSTASNGSHDTFHIRSHETDYRRTGSNRHSPYARTIRF